MLPIPESKIVKKWRLQPGKMFLIDMEAGRIIDDKELKDNLANAKPYKSWIDAVRIKLDEIEPKAEDVATQRREAAALLDRQQAFGYTQEDLKFLMAPMAQPGEEAIGSMGNDSPLAVMSNKNKTLYHYFKQLFAQVTNPPIDPIREEHGDVAGVVHRPEAEPARHQQHQPADAPRSVAAGARLRGHGEDPRTSSSYTGGKFSSYELDICYPVAWGKEGIEARLASLCAEAVDAVQVRLQHPDRVGPQDRPRQRRDSGAAGDVGDPHASGAARACARARAWSSRPARRAKCITSRCSRATARKPCIRTSRMETLAELARRPAGRPVGARRRSTTS